jgi:hypothetical protein
MLANIDFDRDFTVECDTSGSGVNTVLQQGADPIAFLQLVPCDSKLADYEQELIGLLQVVCHWRLYLWGRSILIKTGHFSLKYLLHQRLATIPQQQWARKLIGFDFWVEFHPDTSNVVANALSCCDTEDTLVMVLSAPFFQLLKDKRHELAVSADLRALMEGVHNSAKGEHWRVLDDFITVHNKVYMPPA